MDGKFESSDKQLEDIYKQLESIHRKLSQDNCCIKSYPNKNSLWEQFLPAVLIMKNIELLNKQANDLLKQTSSESQKETPNEVPKENSSKAGPEEIVPNSKFKESEDGSPGELAVDIIKLRDQILLAKLSCNDGKKSILNSLYEELGRILKTNGIEELDSQKVFNSEWNTVVDVKSTNIKEMDNTIADICRPGYKMGGKIIRAQEVVVYRYEHR